MISLYQLTPHGASLRQFLWINKSMESSKLSRIKEKEARSILRFVQKNRTIVHRRRQRPRSRNVHELVAFKTESRLIVPGAQQGELEDFGATHGDGRTSNAFRSMLSKWRVNAPINSITPGSGVDPFVSTVVPSLVGCTPCCSMLKLAF